MSVSEAVDPVKTELRELADRVSTLESSRSSGVGPASSGKSPLDLQTQRMINSLDPALRRVAFVGFAPQSSAEARVKLIDDFVARFPSFHKVSAGNFYTGPRSNRKLSQAGFVEFASDELREDFLKAVGTQTVTLAGGSIKVKRARTKVNGARDYALRSASDKLKEAPEARGKNIKIEWKERVVKVGDDEAFQQEKDELSGRFVGTFAHLRLR